MNKKLIFPLLVLLLLPSSVNAQLSAAARAAEQEDLRQRAPRLWPEMGALLDDLYTLGDVVNGVTSSVAELNILDGVTSTTAELNILDGVTSTAAELNILDGVTSTAAELNILDGVTSTAAELNILDGVTSTAAELNILDGVTATAAELDEYSVHVRITDVSTAASYWVVAPHAGNIVKVWTVINGAIATANDTITLELAGTLVTDSAVTITQVGSAAGDVDSSTPSAANTVTAGQAIEVITDGLSTNTITADVTIVISR